MSGTGISDSRRLRPWENLANLNRTTNTAGETCASVRPPLSDKCRKARNRRPSSITNTLPRYRRSNRRPPMRTRSTATRAQTGGRRRKRFLEIISRVQGHGGAPPVSWVSASPRLCRRGRTTGAGRASYPPSRPGPERSDLGPRAPGTRTYRDSRWRRQRKRFTRLPPSSQNQAAPYRDMGTTLLSSKTRLPGNRKLILAFMMPVVFMPSTTFTWGGTTLRTVSVAELQPRTITAS